MILVFGFGIAVISALRFRKPTDRAVMVMTLSLARFRVVWRGITAMDLLAVKWRLLPISGMCDVVSRVGSGNLLHHLTLQPACRRPRRLRWWRA